MKVEVAVKAVAVLVDDPRWSFCVFFLVADPDLSVCVLTDEPGLSVCSGG